MNRHILITDDEQHIRETLEAHLTPQGFTISGAADGNDALSRMERTRFDLLLSDIVMPNMNGVDLLRHVRIHYPMVRVIMMTGHVTLENALACMRHGADTCVFKPFESFEPLDEAVRNSCACLDKWESIFKKLIDMKPDNKE